MDINHSEQIRINNKESSQTKYTKPTTAIPITELPANATSINETANSIETHNTKIEMIFYSDFKRAIVTSNKGIIKRMMIEERL